VTSTANVVIDRQNPWPGLLAFDEKSEQFFNGREDEISQLYGLLLQGTLTTLFGRSGLGKTSLLGAGLFPLLRKNNFLPIYVRVDFYDHSTPLIEQAKLALQAEIASRHVEAPSCIDESLWEYLHREGLELWSDRNKLLTPVFVFDQFEEVFTLGVENRSAVKQLRTDLADLVQNRMPEAFAKKHPDRDDASLDRDPRGREEPHRPDRISRQRYKLLLSFREEFLPQIDDWKREIPSIQRNCLHLHPMSKQHAIEAVYKTGSHLMDQEMAEKIVLLVAGREEQAKAVASTQSNDESEQPLEIEPALLSLMCRGLNERRKALRKPGFDETLLRAGTPHSIISEYYDDAVRGLPMRVRNFIQKQLITERGFRKPYVADDLDHIPDLPRPQLNLLIDRRVLRTEPLQDTYRIELIHDLLTPVVRQRRDQQREAQWLSRLVLYALAAIIVVLGVALYKVHIDGEVAAARDEARTEKLLSEQKEQKLALLWAQSVAAQQRYVDQRAAHGPEPTPAPSLGCAKSDNGQTYRVYEQIRSEKQRPLAERVGESLAQKCFVIPTIQVLPIGPAKTELRYFQSNVKEKATLAASITTQALGSTAAIVPTYVTGYEQSTVMHAGHLELWMAPPQLTSEIKIATTATQIADRKGFYDFNFSVDAPDAVLKEIGSVEYLFSAWSGLKENGSSSNAADKFAKSYPGNACIPALKISITSKSDEAEGGTMVFDGCHALGWDKQ